MNTNAGNSFFQAIESGDTMTLSDKIDKLFKTVRPQGREYSYDEVARGCSELSGGTFSKAYVWQLRVGQRDNPTKRHLEALAQFFGVPVAYFFDDAVAGRVDAQLDLAVALRGAGVRDIALRAAEMDDAGRQALSRIITEVNALRTASPTQRDSESDSDRNSDS
ncbi:hypothetical protein GCM10012285_24670 [Streptomyces kronopolitis]|uniref:HTH cro/C1-type domain-containing protein n=2 Tax=Streptomyces kronopolitis TaxID=1612435 RepID=A0ABQ2JDZ9_9ACTN|nr:hypothetical protein GCM10012285_24670 [Streptomyces kronopolitis]